MGEHALLSASSSSIWLNCTPSARFGEAFPDGESVYAKEGTLAHELVNLFLYSSLVEPKEDDCKRLEKFMQHELYSSSMTGYAHAFGHYVEELFLDIKLATPDAVVELEQRLDYSKYVPGGFGTGDVILIGDSVLHVIDFKYGKGVAVHAENNSQLMLYALGAYDKYSMLFDVDTIKMTIYQPRLDNISEWAISVSDLLDWAEKQLKPKAALAYDGGGEFVAGKHCRFCKGRFVCKALAHHYLRLQEYEGKNSADLSTDEVSDIMLIADGLTSWVEDVKSYALKQALNGVRYRGFKVVEGRSNRVYSNDDDVAKRLANEGYGEDDIYTKKIKGVTALEKLLTKKKFNALLNDLVVKPSGSPVLVTLADRRPVYNSAELDFKDTDI